MVTKTKTKVKHNGAVDVNWRMRLWNLIVFRVCLHKVKTIKK